VPAVRVAGVEESVARVRLCSSDGREIGAEAWGEALVRDGFVAQLNGGGFVGNGPMAVRFRKGEVVGDVYGDVLKDGCRDYIFRFMIASAASRASPLRWQSVFGDGEYSHFRFCMSLFAEDPRFPFTEDSYAWGCDQPVVDTFVE